MKWMGLLAFAVFTFTEQAQGVDEKAKVTIQHHGDLTPGAKFCRLFFPEPLLIPLERGRFAYKISHQRHP